MKIALAQINPTVGDIAANAAAIADAIDKARACGAELAVFGELAVTGYPPRDLLSRAEVVDASMRAVEMLAGQCNGIAALVGFVRWADQAKAGRPLENAAALLADGRIQAVHVKTLLPTYDVFDETRYFRPGPTPMPLAVDGVNVGVSICEDLWDRPALGRALYEQDPPGHLAKVGAKVIVNLSASPYQMHKLTQREELMERQARRTGAAIVYVNQVGGNDELIFDGYSMAVGADGRLLGRAKGFAEDLLIVDTDGSAGRCEIVGEDMEQLYAALRLGLRDYVRKCGFKSVVLGLSGGIDSALVATLAADALGPENVLALAMPSRYSSDHSVSDAVELAQRLGIRLVNVPIERIHAAYEAVLDTSMGRGRPETTDENIQARIRGNVVMAFSNAEGHLALATGNKSELATGYCTLYGDMAGGLAVIGDVLKTDVYRLARHINQTTGGRIPQSSLDKPPSAELKPGQVDQDKLPPYDVLDEIIDRYVGQEISEQAIVEQGFDPAMVHRVVGMIVSAEYKRRQAAPALKISPRAFGSGRRIPIAARRGYDADFTFQQTQRRQMS